jgi:hypothetical protein
MISSLYTPQQSEKIKKEGRGEGRSSCHVMLQGSDMLFSFFFNVTQA